MFAATYIVKNSDKSKWMCSGYGIAFGILSSCCYGNDFASNILSFDNCSSFHGDNCKKKILVLGERLTHDINW